MLLFHLLFILLSAVVSNGQAGISFTAPREGQVVEPGGILQIAWIPTTAASITLVLQSGDASNLVTVETLVSKYPMSPGTYAWPVPLNFATSTQYIIKIVTSDGSSTHSPYFTVGAAAPASSSASSAGSSSSSLSAHPTIASSASAKQTTVTVSITSAESTQSAHTAVNAAHTNPKLSSGAIAGIVIGAVAGLVLIVLLALLSLRQRRKARNAGLTAVEADDGKVGMSQSDAYDLSAPRNESSASELDASAMGPGTGLSELDGKSPHLPAELESLVGGTGRSHCRP